MKDEKEREILSAIQGKDSWKLRELALSEGGLLNDSLRRQAWPLLVDVTEGLEKDKQKTGEQTGTVCLKDWKLIEFDAARGSWEHIPLESESTLHATIDTELIIRNKQKRLAKLIREALSCSSSFAIDQPQQPHRVRRYYQGFHDVAAIVLSVFDDHQAVDVLHNLSHTYLMDCCMRGNSLVPLLTILRLTILPMIAYIDRAVHSILTTGEDIDQFDPTCCCLPWIMTWFSHDFDSTIAVKRFFDAALASHPLFVIYASVAVMLQKRNELLNTNTDAASIHEILKDCKNDGLSSVENAIEQAIDVMRRIPPHRILNLATRYYGDERVQEWLTLLTPTDILMLLSSSPEINPPSYLLKQKQSLAVVAAGFGDGDYVVKQRRRKIRRILAVFFLFISVICFSCLLSMPDTKQQNQFSELATSGKATAVTTIVGIDESMFFNDASLEESSWKYAPDEGLQVCSGASRNEVLPTSNTLDEQLEEESRSIEYKKDVKSEFFKLLNLPSKCWWFETNESLDDWKNDEPLQCAPDDHVEDCNDDILDFSNHHDAEEGLMSIEETTLLLLAYLLEASKDQIDCNPATDPSFDSATSYETKTSAKTNDKPEAVAPGNDNADVTTTIPSTTHSPSISRTKKLDRSRPEDNSKSQFIAKVNANNGQTIKSKIGELVSDLLSSSFLE